MAYPIDTTLLEQFKDGDRQSILITMQTGETTTTITEDNVMDGGLSINRCSVGSDKIEIGSVIASELTLILDNSQNTYATTKFEGAELYVKIGIGESYIPMGYFTIDQSPRKLQSIQLVGLDRMVLFDKKVDATLLTFPLTIEALVGRISDICNVEVATTLTTLPNYNHIVTSFEMQKDLTYRQILSWCAEIMGVCAFIDWNGQLVLKWYEDSDTQITSSDRFDSDMFEDDIEITGIQITKGVVSTLAGTDDYALNINGNLLIGEDENAILNNLSEILIGFKYRPYECITLPMPHLYPLDQIAYVDKLGIAHNSIVTNYTFGINQNTSIGGIGISVTRDGYASMNPLTNRETVIINQLSQDINKTLNDRLQTSLALNELVSNALGLYFTAETQIDGSTLYYMHNKKTLEDSNLIYTMTSNGIAWTNSGWNEGNPTWEYGVTNAGNALFKMLSAEGIEISKVGENYNVEITPSTFKIYYQDIQIFSIDQDVISLGAAGENKLSIKVENDRIVFFEGGNEIAWFSSNQFHIENGEVTNSLKIGNYAFLPRANGSVDFTKVG